MRHPIQYYQSAPDAPDAPDAPGAVNYFNVDLDDFPIFLI